MTDESPSWVISSHGTVSPLTLLSSKLFLTFQPPSTPTQIKSFLGLAGYYLYFVKSFSSIVSPLHALSRTNTSFNWNTDYNSSFQTLKMALASPTTTYPDFTLPFRL